jgi:UDP-N-acetylglucosamine 3-dehydrogenase
MNARDGVQIILFGSGAMGRNHARVLRQSRDIYLVGVIEPDPARAAAVGAELGVPTWSTLSDCPLPLDAAVVATPTPTHEAIVLDCLDRGLHVLVEKPISHTAESGQRMVDRAAKVGKVLMVGHIERFNAAVMALPQFLEDPIHFTCQRIGPYDPRIKDGITLDLMIHDLDIVRFLTGLPGTAVCGLAVAMHGQTEDHASASMVFGERLTATFTASRVGQSKIRSIEIAQPKNSISVDLIRQDITIHTIESVDFSASGNSLRQRGLVEIPFIERAGQPLAAELAHFAACVRGEVACITPGEDGLAALGMVTDIQSIATTIRR